MKKILAGLVVVLIVISLILLGSSAVFANATLPEEESPVNEIPEVSLPVKVEPVSEIKTSEISIKEATVDMQTAIKTQPVNLIAYIGIGVNYLAAIVTRLLETGRPTVLFYEEIKNGVEITLLENLLIKNLDLIGGLILNGNEEDISENWKDKAYLGLEYQIIIPGMWDIFSEFGIGVYGSKEGFCLGLSCKIQ